MQRTPGSRGGECSRQQGRWEPPKHPRARPGLSNRGRGGESSTLRLARWAGLLVKDFFRCPVLPWKTTSSPRHLASPSPNIVEATLRTSPSFSRRRLGVTYESRDLASLELPSLGPPSAAIVADCGQIGGGNAPFV